METLHLTILLITGIVIAIADHDAFLYLRGKHALLPKRKTKLLHYGVWIGLILMIATGAVLAFPFRDYYLTDMVFIVKMCIVVALVSNGILIGKLSSVATSVPYAALPFSRKAMLLASGFISTCGWIGATIIGLFFL